MIVASNVPRKFENRTKVAVLGGLFLHGAMDYEDDFDSITSLSHPTIRCKACRHGHGAINTTNIAHIFLDAATVWLQDRISSQIYIPDAREV